MLYASGLITHYKSTGKEFLPSQMRNQRCRNTSVFKFMCLKKYFRSKNCRYLNYAFEINRKRSCWVCFVLFSLHWLTNQVVTKTISIYVFHGNGIKSLANSWHLQQQNLISDQIHFGRQTCHLPLSLIFLEIWRAYFIIYNSETHTKKIMDMNEKEQTASTVLPWN